ncbi:hypothetical protein MDA_GLEAN10006569 [Myotis davidii]|uniref:Uncharacterized protein n=1 Tax=Myotis davidii TaxID=225400 RepID=L5M500_MYODS|nr:hypothetical protein MDA_GLEAN10006569 [Myotis davidii]
MTYPDHQLADVQCRSCPLLVSVLTAGEHSGGRRSLSSLHGSTKDVRLMASEQQLRAARPHMRSSSPASNLPLSKEKQPHEQPTPIQGVAVPMSSLPPSKEQQLMISPPPSQEQQPHEQPTPVQDAAAP